jgi:acetyl esterase/lipase
MIDSNQSRRPLTLVVHGGAWEIPDGEIRAHAEGL